MIYHCTKALAAKLPDVSSKVLSGANPKEDWHGHFYIIDRRQCVMFCHDTTRIIVLLVGLRKERFRELAQLHREAFRAVLVAMGVGESAIDRAILSMREALWDTATDRSVLSALNQSRSDLDGFLSSYSNIMEVDPVEVARWLNKRPICARGKWLWPEKDMLELIARL